MRPLPEFGSHPLLLAFTKALVPGTESLLGLTQAKSLTTVEGSDDLLNSLCLPLALPESQCAVFYGPGILTHNRSSSIEVN